MIRDDKISKTDVAQYLPPYLSQDSMRHQILAIVKEKLEIAQEQNVKDRKNLEEMVISTRKQFDMQALMRKVD